MPKWIKLIIAILLLPVCIGAGTALVQVVRASGSADTTWVPLLAGAMCWMVIYFFLPKPMLLYVFGHEFTHVLWVWLFGGKVKQFKVGSGGGHVVTDTTNFLIALAPYFFPLYAVLVVVVFALGQLLWDWHDYLAFFHLFVGAAYSFHVTLTLNILKTQQSDITSQGYLFSAVIIFLGNVIVLLLGIPFLTAKIGHLKALDLWIEGTLTVVHQLQGIF